MPAPMAEVPTPTVAPAKPSHRPRVAHIAWAIAGFVSFGLGALGAILPILPTTPFLLVAAFCFARSSERINTWFRGTALYKKVLEGYVRKRAMTVKAKLAIILPVTVIMGVGFALMGAVPVGRVVLAAVWIAHLIYFGFIVKTEKALATGHPA